MLHIALSGEKVFEIGNFIITNTLLTTWVVMAILIGLSVVVSQNLSLFPSRFQAFIEFVIGGLYSTFESILGKNVKKFFPILASIFIFIIVANWFGLLPGVGHAIVVKQQESTLEVLPVDGQETPLFRAPTADLNTTIALALISFVLIQVTGFQALGSAYTKKFLNFSGGLPFYVGILETISELGKIISFAFRLYGNIFAGEVLIAVISFLIPVVATVPFLGLEIFVGFIQALVFSMLTTVFLSVAMVHEEH